ncbi:hypothetical protein A3K64_02395 [Candidatus Micrarchaeota archaeon RBG_16_36_9]|nr:MAG: hypothetical protein A3K64_02395 [Candidatus Micrarchaeota archaeon RBG_16_36_9]
MAILSNVDIGEEMNSGRISIDPRPISIGPISLDLTVDEISELEMKYPREIFEELRNFEGCYSFKDLADFKIHWKPKPPDTLDGGYLLRKNQWYMVKHHEKIKSEPFEPKLVKRSSAARRGLYQLAESIEDKTPTEIIVPFISNIVRKGESITQIVFSEPNTRHITGEEFDRTSSYDFGYFNKHNQIKHNIIIAMTPGTTEQEHKRIMKDEEVNLGISINPVVKYFNDSEDGTLYSKDKFVEIDLRDKTVPTFGGHTKFFTLAKSSEKIHIGNKYVGELMRAAPSPVNEPIHPYDAIVQLLKKQYVHATVTNCSAPYIQPGSDGHVVFEIPQGSGIQPYTIMLLNLIPVRTPGVPYNNRLNKTGEIIVP